MWIYLVLGILALIVYVIKGSKSDYWAKRGVPTASGYEFIFGHYRPVFFLQKHMCEFYDAMYKEFPDAPLIGYYTMGAPSLMIKNLEIVKTIAVTNFSNFNSNGFNIDKKEDILGAAHPFVLVGEEWKTARSHITPTLGVSKLKSYLPTMLDVGNNMVKYLTHKCAGSTTELEATELAEKFTTDVIANAIYGVNNNAFENKDSLFCQLTKEIKIELSLRDHLKIFVRQIPIVKSLFPKRFAPRKLQDLMGPFTRKVISETTVSEDKRNVFQTFMTTKENDTREALTVDYMIGLAFTIIVGLYESANGAIAFMLYMLSRHLEIQERLRSEINQIQLRNGGNFTIEDIENAKYLEMFFCESFRFYSFVLTKECTQDCYLPVSNSESLEITKGTRILIPISSIHMDPKYYPNPEKFDPERFSQEEIAKRPKFSYMPFGEGPKKCMGVRIVTLEIKVALVKILEKFTVKPSMKTKYPFDLDPAAVVPQRPKNGVWVHFEPIKK